MAFGNSEQERLVRLGKALKHKRRRSEQFAVFAFDLHLHDSLLPDPAGVPRECLPLLGTTDYVSHDAGPSNWNAAFYNDVKPSHTEKALLGVMGQWLGNYLTYFVGRRPGEQLDTTLYIYSFLIPCMRDCGNGMCADNLVAFSIWFQHNFGRDYRLTLRIGWGNDDRSVEDAMATKHQFADVIDDGIDVELYPRTSIAG